MFRCFVNKTCKSGPFVAVHVPVLEKVVRRTGLLGTAGPGSEWGWGHDLWASAFLPVQAERRWCQVTHPRPSHPIQSCVFLAAVWPHYQADTAVLSLLVGVAHGAVLHYSLAQGKGRFLCEDLRESSAATLAPPASSTQCLLIFCYSKQPILSNCSESEQLSRNFVCSIFNFQ